MCGPGSLFRAGLGSGAQTFCPPCRGQVCGPPGSAGPFLEPWRRGVRVLPQGPGIPGAAPERRLPLTAPSNTGTLSSGARSQALPSPLQLRESWLLPFPGKAASSPRKICWTVWHLQELSELRLPEHLLLHQPLLGQGHGFFPDTVLNPPMPAPDQTLSKGDVVTAGTLNLDPSDPGLDSS